MAIYSTTDNIKRHKELQDKKKLAKMSTEPLSHVQARKTIMYKEYLCKEEMGLIFTFLPFGVLKVRGAGDNPIIYHWEMKNMNNNEWYITIIPYLTVTPSTMKANITDSDLELISLQNPSEQLHFFKKQKKTLYHVGN